MAKSGTYRSYQRGAEEAHAGRLLLLFRILAVAAFVACMLTLMLCMEEEPKPSLTVAGAITAAISGVLTIVFLLRCRRLQGQIDACRAGRGAEPKAWRRMPVVLLVGIVIIEAGIIARPAMDQVPGLYQTLCWIGMAAWAVGMYQLFVKRA